MRTITKPGLAAVLAFVLVACDSQPKVAIEQGADKHGFTAPTDYTIKANAAVAKQLALADQADFENAAKGLIARADTLQASLADGKTVWNQSAYDFVKDAAPSSVNPSLWRQAKLNGQHGLYKVADRIYQLRGFDLANMTIIEGDSGWILVDPLTVKQTAATALAFARQHLPPKPIKAILFTHSHVDHFGGIDGILESEGVDATQLQVIAPAGFMEEATSENVMAGLAMQRRAVYMYGRNLPRSARGHVDTGLGKEPPLGGDISILPPTQVVSATGQKIIIDGLEFEFQYTPASEAPAEFTFYLPALKAFCGAEVVSRNMHNVYTLRGTKVRDALLWSNYIDEALNRFGQRADVYFASHHWPLWGNEAIVGFLKKQRDTYKFIHDQTMRLANGGFTPREIADSVTLPDSLQQSFANRGYYGTTSHNTKAVYQWYFGWYDGNPANLNPLPPTAAAHKYIAFMGGAEVVLQKAQNSFDAGEYRWVAEIMNHLVFAAPNNADARALLAKTYDQLGYQAESGPWRDVYLSAAYELRHGKPDKASFHMNDALGLLKQMPVEKFFDSMAARLHAEAAADENTIINIEFTDLGKKHVLWLENSVLHHKEAEPNPQANATLKVTHEFFLSTVVGNIDIKEMLLGDSVEVEGSTLDLIGFLRLLEKPDGNFEIVVP